MPDPPELPEQEKDIENRAVESFNRYAETVGGVPSLRLGDNLLQGAFIFIVTAICTAIGYIRSDSESVFLYFIYSLVGSFLVSGIFLTILGWVRYFRNRRPHK